MAFKLVQIEKWLGEMNISYSQESVDDTFVNFDIENEFDEGFFVYIRSVDNGEIFQLQAEPKRGLDVKPIHEFAGIMIPQLLQYNYNLKFGTWEYDKERGDLRFAVEIPLADAQMTLGQFKKIVEELRRNLGLVGKIRNILTQGKVTQ